eukprot:9988726-Alexandrium_andersonii.AAC.1
MRPQPADSKHLDPCGHLPDMEPGERGGAPPPRTPTRPGLRQLTGARGCGPHSEHSSFREHLPSIEPGGEGAQSHGTPPPTHSQFTIAPEPGTGPVTPATCVSGDTHPE